MVNLLKAELLRLISRRMVWAVLFGLAAVAVFQSLILMSSVAPLTEQDHLAAEQTYESELRYWEEWRADCDADPACHDEWDMSDMSPASYLRYVSSLPEFIQWQFESGSVVLLLVAAFMAILVTAADFGNGALATQLTFTPRRNGVFIARVFGGVIAGMGLAVATLLVGTLASSLVFLSLRPVSDFVVSSELFAMASRFLVTALVCVLGASLLAMLLGSVVGGLGVTSGVFVVSLFTSEMVGDRPVLLQLLPWPNLNALLTGEYKWMVYRPMLGYWESEVLFRFPQAVVYFAVLLLIVGAAALWRFRRRDLVI